MTFERVEKPLADLPNLPSGKAMIVFESEYELQFDSNNEYLPKPEYRGGRYLLTVTEGSQQIFVFYNGIPTAMNFGTKSTIVNQYEQISAGDVWRFKVKVRAELEYSDITESELRRGSGIVPIGMNVSDAMIVFRKFPDDLELTVNEKNGNITKRTKDGSALNVSLRVKESGENRYSVTVVSNDGDSLNIPIQSLTSKEVRVFRIKKPIMESPISNTRSNSAITKQGGTTPYDEQKITATAPKKDFSVNLVGFWAGSLGDKKVNLDISRLDPERNRMEGRIFIDDMKANFKGQVKFKNVDDYQASLSFVSQGAAYYGATIDFTYRKGVMTGLYIDDSGNAMDFTCLRTQRLMADTIVAMSRISKGAIADSLKGEWMSMGSGQSMISSIEVSESTTEGELNVRVLTFSREVFSKRCRITGTSASPTIYLSDYRTKDMPMSATLTFVLRNSRMEVNLTGDDGRFSRMGSFYRKTQYAKDESVGSTYLYKIIHVSSENTYLYERPNKLSRTSLSLPRGQIIDFTEVNGNFLKVLTPNKSLWEAYVSTSTLSISDLSYIFDYQWATFDVNSKIRMIFNRFSQVRGKSPAFSGYLYIDTRRYAIEGYIERVVSDYVKFRFKSASGESQIRDSNILFNLYERKAVSEICLVDTYICKEYQLR